ncbi:MAG: peptide deformylase [Epsilonproteobacteria bacterium]|nr:peptide deformylase [Campylobacterota bacterium]
MIREVITYPNKLLKQKSQDVEDFDQSIHTLLDDMYETMLTKNGIGLAAIQIAEPLNILIINLPNENDEQTKENLIEIINPKILNKKGSTLYTEGCLSVPEYYEDVERAEWIKVSYQDRNGNLLEKEYDGLMAIAFQHECDHLNGELFIEKLSFLKRKKFEKEWKKKLKGKK